MGKDREEFHQPPPRAWVRRTKALARSACARTFCSASINSRCSASVSGAASRASFSVSYLFFCRGEIGLSVPLAYPPLLYLLVRLLLLALHHHLLQLLEREADPDEHAINSGVDR